MLPLDRPLAWIDAETTGTDPWSDRLVELSVIVHYPDGREPVAKTQRMNPGVPIPAEATLVHGIRDSDVAGCPFFRLFAHSLFEQLDPCDLAGFGIRRFDVPLLVAEFHRVGLYFDARSRRLIDALSIFHHQEPRDLAGAARFYLGREHTDAHSPAADVALCPDILEAQIRRYGLPGDLGAVQASIDEHSPYEGGLGLWFKMESPDRPVDWIFKRGKHKGDSLGYVAQNDPSYCWWMCNKADDMPFDVVAAVEPFAGSRS